MQEIDFTNCKRHYKAYGGANGSKISIFYNDELYMLKFPPKPSKNGVVSYTNSCFSEYISCHILKSLDLDAQDTILGNFNDKVVVACKDFTQGGFDFFDFASLKNSVIDSSGNGYGTELNDILYAIDNQVQFNIDQAEVKRFFWDMFIGDTLLGNFDRHNGNWGFLVDPTNANCKLAPIFDCGSCLYPQMGEEGFKNVMNNKEEIEKRIYVFPNSAIRENGVKINPFNFLKTTTDSDCIEALRRITQRINIKKINEIVDNTPYISNNHKNFLKTMIKSRKTLILEEILRIKFQNEKGFKSAKSEIKIKDPHAQNVLENAENLLKNRSKRYLSSIKNEKPDNADLGIDNDLKLIDREL